MLNMSMLVVTHSIRIPLGEIELTYARSSGPGGQNVNKVNSKAVLRWNLAGSPSLAEDVRSRLMQKLASRLTRDGDLLVTCDLFRDQGRNRETCYEKLCEILRQAAFQPKARGKTKPTHASRRKNRESKRRQSEKKRLRRSRGHED